MPEAESDQPTVTTNDKEVGQTTESRKAGAWARKLLPWLLGACVVFLGMLAAFATFEILTGSPAFSRATPTLAFLPGTWVKLVGPEDGSVTVWHVEGGCEVGLAFGQVPPGTDAQIREEACYNREHRTIYYSIALLNRSTGWVRADHVVLAAEYTPPPPTGTIEPTDTPWPTPTLPPTPTPTPPPLPVGSPLYTRSWGVRVDRVEVVGSLSSPPGDKTVEAGGRFVLLYMSVTNQGSRSGTLHASSVFIEDIEGNRYPNDDVASAYASTAGCPDFALDVAPGGSACIVAAIDIPAGGDFYLFSLQGAREYVLLDVP